MTKSDRHPFEAIPKSNLTTASNEQAGAADKPSLFIIDDDRDLLDLIEAFFRPRGYKTHLYEDAEHALKDLEEGKVACDVVLTDLNLPSMSGLELTERLVKQGARQPIILMTATTTAEIAVRAIEAGAYDFVVKPLHFPQLFVSVERALHLVRIRRENAALKSAVKGKGAVDLEGVIGRSPAFLRALDLARRVSGSTASVFVSGESGTGKEVIARAIHGFGPRKAAPFIAINCSAIPENLLESELFGYAKGAFTGASDKKIGLFEEAQGGSLFLDEIGDLPLQLQAKLLRVIQERKIKRLGENQERNIDVRVISATHKDLEVEVSHGRFREDLFFRLNVIPIQLPPLRQRREDIVPLAEFFLAKYAALNGCEVEGFNKSAIAALIEHPWKGNVRELENTIERAVVLTQTSKIEVADLFIDSMNQVETESKVEISAGGMPLGPEGRLLTLEELTNSYVQFALEKNGGAKDRTARELGIDRKTLYRRISLVSSAPGSTDDSLGDLRGNSAGGAQPFHERAHGKPSAFGLA